MNSQIIQIIMVINVKMAEVHAAKHVPLAFIASGYRGNYLCFVCATTKKCFSITSVSNQPNTVTDLGGEKLYIQYFN